MLEKILQELRDNKNAIDTFVTVLENVQKIPQILENQRKIIDLLENSKGSSNEFRQHVKQTADRLTSIGEDINSKGKEENK